MSAGLPLDFKDVSWVEKTAQNGSANKNQASGPLLFS
jgi:hypothetical protein